jgi:hypothetical protein
LILGSAVQEATSIPSTETVGICCHDFSLNALEIVKSRWDDSVFFSNINQMSLIKPKCGFDEFFGGEALKLHVLKHKVLPRSVENGDKSWRQDSVFLSTDFETCPTNNFGILQG